MESLSDSPISSADYTITGTVIAPSLSPGSGIYTGAQTVTISCTTAGASIRYTTNGDEPTATTGTLIASGSTVTVDASQTLKAAAFKTGWASSPASSADYTITGTVATPTLSLGTGTYSSAQAVTISCATTGASIRYTTNGNVPTATTGILISSGATVSVAASQTIMAMAFKTNWDDSPVASADYTITGTVAAPSLSPGSGIYTGAQTVTISCATTGATIRYTTNGDEPTATTGTLIASGSTVTVATSQTLKAAAFKTGWASSPASSADYTITGTVATPTLSLGTGTYSSAQAVTISCATTGASIRYTTNGNMPTATMGILVSSGTTVSVAASQTIMAMAFKTNWDDSPVASAVYTISGTMAAPVLSPGAGVYTSAQTVTVTCSTPGALIRYTTNGIDPTSTTGTLIASGSTIAVAASETVKAIAFRTDWTDSTVTNAAYSITGIVSMPSFTVGAGTYTSTQSVNITCATVGASIRYTIDGSPPSTSNGTLIASGALIPVSASQTLKAIAYLANWADSAIASAAYVITGTVDAPVLGVTAGTYTTARSVSITCATSGATIRYTTDGTDPSPSAGTQIASGSSVSISSTKTLKAIAYKINWDDSPIVTANYTITGTVATPTLSPSAGAYPSAQTITINCATPGASIRYTTDGSAPTMDIGTLVSSGTSIVVDTSRTVKAIAFQTGWDSSAVAQAAYTIGSAATVSISFSLPTDETINLSVAPGQSISRTSILSVTVSQVFSSYQWILDGWDQAGTSATFQIDCSTISLGKHYLTALVSKNGALYSKQLIFTVTY